MHTFSTPFTFKLRRSNYESKEYSYCNL